MLTKKLKMILKTQTQVVNQHQRQTFPLKCFFFKSVSAIFVCWTLPQSMLNEFL